MSINSYNSKLKLRASEGHLLQILQYSVGNMHKVSVKTKIETLSVTGAFATHYF